MVEVREHRERRETPDETIKRLLSSSKELRDAFDVPDTVKDVPEGITDWRTVSTTGRETEERRRDIITVDKKAVKARKEMYGRGTFGSDTGIAQLSTKERIRRNVQTLSEGLVRDAKDFFEEGDKQRFFNTNMDLVRLCYNTDPRHDGDTCDIATSKLDEIIDFISGQPVYDEQWLQFTRARREEANTTANKYRDIELMVDRSELADIARRNILESIDYVVKGRASQEDVGVIVDAATAGGHTLTDEQVLALMELLSSIGDNRQTSRLMSAVPVKDVTRYMNTGILVPEVSADIFHNAYGRGTEEEVHDMYDEFKMKIDVYGTEALKRLASDQATSTEILSDMVDNCFDTDVPEEILKNKKLIKDKTRRVDVWKKLMRCGEDHANAVAADKGIFIRGDDIVKELYERVGVTGLYNLSKNLFLGKYPELVRKLHGDDRLNALDQHTSDSLLAGNPSVADCCPDLLKDMINNYKSTSGSFGTLQHEAVMENMASNPGIAYIDEDIVNELIDTDNRSVLNNLVNNRSLVRSKAFSGEMDKIRRSLSATDTSTDTGR